MTKDRFINEFTGMQFHVFDVNRANGWWEERDDIITSKMPGAEAIVIIGCLGLITSEVAEAMEAVRKHAPETWGDAETKDTLVRELAGTIIRCMDLAEHLGLPLAQAIIEENEANKARGYKHGGKAA